MGLLLFIIASTLTLFVGSLSLVFSIVYYIATLKFKSGLKALNRFFYKIALSIDQLGNVICATPFQFIFTKGLDVHPFGDEDDTVSYVIARNYNKESLTWFGRLLAYTLDLCDKGHLRKAIESKIEKDAEAMVRAISKKYYE
jgi:hypothetical protein